MHEPHARLEPARALPALPALPASEDEGSPAMRPQPPSQALRGLAAVPLPPLDEPNRARTADRVESRSARLPTAMPLPDRTTRSRDASQTHVMLAKRLRGSHANASTSTSSLRELDTSGGMAGGREGATAATPVPEHVDVMARSHRRRSSESAAYFAAHELRPGVGAAEVKIGARKGALRLADFRLSRALGSGGMATVVRAESIRGGTEVALKAVPKKGLSKRAQHYLAREIAIHRSVQGHPHVVSLYDVFEDATGIYLVLELLRGGDLYSVLKRERGGFGERMALQIVGQVLDALQFMHAQGCAHRDIKPENIMFKERPNFTDGCVPTVKIVDFGLAWARNPNASEKSRSSSEKCGTVRYAAPEIVKETSYVPELCDLWSVGVVLYSLIAHSNPYTGKTEKEVMQQIQNTELSFSGLAWTHVSGDTKKLIRECLSRKPSERPTAARAFNDVHRILKLLSVSDGASGAIVEDSWDAEASRRRSTRGSHRSLDLSGFSSNVTGEESSSNGRRERGPPGEGDSPSSSRSSSDDGTSQPTNFFDSWVKSWFSNSSPSRNEPNVPS